MTTVVGAPSFSVVIAAYQAAATIADAVESALAQTLPPHEVVVCDDGSTDATASVLERYDDAIVVVRKPNGGGASALNAAVAAATGDFTVVLDADDVYLPERIEALAALASARPDFDVLSTDAFFDVDGRTTGRFNIANPFPETHQRRAVLDRCFVFAPAIRRDRLAAIGGYDESLRIAYDWDCLLRVVLDGAAVGLVREPLMRYRIRAGSLAANRVESLRERVLVLEKASQFELNAAERATLENALARNRGRAEIAAMASSLRARAPDGRLRAWKVARSPGVPPATRVLAVASALLPRVGASVLEHRERRTGRSRADRPTPR